MIVIRNVSGGRAAAVIQINLIEISAVNCTKMVPLQRAFTKDMYQKVT